ncbi:DinB family protein [bacterium]|nr:DinB family protein [bacterium]
MADIISNSPSRRFLSTLYSGTWEHEHPRRILAGISPEQACTQIDGLPYTIAGLLSHMCYWQDRRVELSNGQAELPEGFQFGVTDFPAVGPDDWNGLVEHFHATLSELLATTEREGAMDLLLFDDRDVGAVILSHALHNSYHFGEIVLMRRLLGNWPPPEDLRPEEY